MTNKEYTNFTLSLKSTHFDNDSVHPDLLHAAMGCVTESAELMDVCKRAFYYGKGKDAVDVNNVVEEMGDCLFYLSIGLNACGSSIEDAMARNIAKLQKRYPDKFSTEKAYNRNLEEEKKAMEEPTLFSEISQ